jgi:hypothetical protein
VLSVNDFDLLISTANRSLLHRTPASIAYTITYDLSQNVTINESVIAQEVGDDANIYAIWSRASSSNKWEVMYIGQRSKGNVIERIKQHLFKTPSGTQSKLEKVKDLVILNHYIGISTILISPDPLRLSVEDQLIFINTNNGSDLPWNNKSRNVSLSRT